MFNVFPEILAFYMLAPLMLRVTLGLIFIYISFFVIYQKRVDFFNYYKKNHYPWPFFTTWFFGILNLLVGIFFIIGFLTQIVSLVSVYLLISLYLSDKEIKSFEFGGVFYILAAVVSLSLIILGAGSFAVDLPL